MARGVLILEQDKYLIVSIPWPGGEVDTDVWEISVSEVLDRSFATWRTWPGGEVVTLRSAKPTCTSSILVLASYKNRHPPVLFVRERGLEQYLFSTPFAATTQGFQVLSDCF